MGTGFSLDPNEYRAAADAIEGYGSAQTDHGTALAAGTSTPLSSSGTGIAGAISMIAQGTVQKIVTDVTSTASGFAHDTASGLHAQAARADQLESAIAGHAGSVLSDAEPGLLSGIGAMTPLGGGGTAGGAGGFGSVGGGGGGGFGSVGAGGLIDATSGSPATSMNNVASSTSTGAGLITDDPVEQSGLSPAEVRTSAASGLAAAAREESPQSPAASLFDEMRGSARSAGSGGGTERGQRPDYLRSRTELTQGGNNPVKAATEKHRAECGVAPIAFGENRLVCAKCGSIIEVADTQTLTT